MSPLQVRKASTEDRAGLLEVWKLTYNSGVPFPDESRVFRHSEPYVALQGDRIVAGYGVMPMTCEIGTRSYRCAGILGVAVHPATRGSGLGQDLMRQALRVAKDEGYAIASLYPFRESFYRKAGYELCGARYKITVETLAFPQVEASLDVRTGALADWQSLVPCYDAFCQSRSGMNRRTEGQWQRVFGGVDASRTLYMAGDPVEAYAIVQHKVDFWADQWVDEFIWSSRAGYETILSVIRGISINKERIGWHEPADSPYFARYFGKGAKYEMDRPVMYRVLDVPKALGDLRGEGAFTLEIDDPELPENRGPWHVELGQDSTVVKQASKASIRLERRHFAQATLGSPSLEELARHGLVARDDAEEFRAAIEAFPSRSVYCADFF